MSTPSSIPFLPALTEISGLKARLLSVPTALHQARRTFTEAQDRENDATRIAAERKAELEYLVLCMPGSDGKPLHGNESARKAALGKACAEDAEYQDAGKAAGLAKGERQALGLEVERIEDEMRALRAVSDLTCSEALLLFGGSR